MNNSKKTIRKSIFLSHISIIIILVILTSIVFNICINIYVRYQTRNQLLSAAQIIQKSLNTQLIGSTKDNTSTDEKTELNSLLKINRILRQTQTFLDIKYAVVNVNNKVIFPRNLVSEEANILNIDILPSLGKKNILGSGLKKNRIEYFSASNIKYAALIHPFASENKKSLGNLILYSDMKNSNQLILSINIILFSIMLVAAIIALIISNTVSKKISKPISLLNENAKKIGDRDYKIVPEKYEDNEIGELAETMKAMAEKLAAYDSTMKTFMQNASHELRTPLMSIQGYAEGIKLGVIEDTNSAADVIIDESKRLTNIVEELLYLSKLDSMQEAFNLEALNTEDLLKDCIDRVKGIALKNGVNIRLTSKDKDLVIMADEEKLSRAIINILGNCLRYSRKEISVSLESLGNSISIIIKDDGPGFDAQELKNIFDRFYKGKGGKHGLGLAITKSIIEKHNGRVTAENNSRSGACFKVILPKVVE
ncbi:sensor histidine kinase [Candidatus Clostridium stratigraminis]|uniref:histidine kinase n=1 Tax=Candidatus Clostridium stratigraminis TaxID=3381661 RepID=A0ABW8SYB0_9CLOT